MTTHHTIAVVIPCYKVCDHILDVVQKIGTDINRIYVIDDCCPDKSGQFVEAHCADKRVVVIYHDKNQGVGGAVMTGYRQAIAEGIDIIVKVDGDGQMDPVLIPQIIAPILSGDADYTKGNRFFDLEAISAMPKMRIFGNAVLSFMTKLSSGYWNLFDPTNGYTAIHTNVAKHLPFSKISRRYFFETDMLFRLNTIRAVVVDVPMEAKYENEVSNLKIKNIVGEFLIKHFINLSKRIFYNYYLRDMSLASFELPIGIVLLSFGAIFGLTQWIASFNSGHPSTAGTVMIPALTIILGFQLVLAFIGYDIATVPNRPLHKRLRPLTQIEEY